MMLVDCHTCPVRDVHCADCMVTALTTIPLRSPDEVVTAPLDRAERRAVSAFLAAGLVSTATANAVRAELDPGDLRPVDLVPADGRPGELGSLRRTRRAV